MKCRCHEMAENFVGRRRDGVPTLLKLRRFVCVDAAAVERARRVAWPLNK